MAELKWKESGVDVINLILAGFLFLTPWIFGFVPDHAAAPNAWVSGIVIGILAIAALTRFAEWEEWLNLALGLWVLVSPWVLGFTTQTNARWAHVIVGLIVAVLAGVKLWFIHQTPPQVTARR
jgi:SPW repeat